MYVVKLGFYQFEWYRAENNSSSHITDGEFFICPDKLVNVLK